MEKNQAKDRGGGRGERGGRERLVNENNGRAFVFPGLITRSGERTAGKHAA